MSQTMLFLLLKSAWQTFYMVAASSIIATIIGFPLGMLLFLSRPKNLLARPWLHHSLAILINVTRSVPFIILMIAVIPFTRLLIGTSIGTEAAIVPLSLCAIPFVARIVENAALEVNSGLIETAMAMGATTGQIITKILLPEARASIINGLTLTVVALIGYSAMAGAVGGGGLGDLAIRYGYQRFDSKIMLITICIMVLFVQVVQSCGDKLAKFLTRCR